MEQNSAFLITIHAKIYLFAFMCAGFAVPLQVRK